MRFAAPRSDSPIRRSTRRRSTYGPPPDSDDDEESTEDSGASSSSESFVYESESEVPAPTPRAKRLGRSVSEQHNIEDMIASIRLRVTHHDAYEEWEQQTRKDAFVSARQEQASVNTARRQSLASSQTQASNSRAVQRQKQMEEVQTIRYRAKLAVTQVANTWNQTWQERGNKIQTGIEHVIKLEEDKVKAQLEAEQRQREEEERKKREAEEAARQEAERKQREAEQKQREEEERQQKLAEEAAAKKRTEEIKKQRAEQEKAESEQRKAFDMTTGLDDWRYAREFLVNLKDGPMKSVKSNKESKPIWSACRRQITPKIGQITNDPQAIAQITQQLIDIVNPSPPHPPPVYLALLSSLAKAILLQAETEVTAEKRSAIPLAHVTANLLQALELFPDVFWAKMCQRAGGWPAPYAIPAQGPDGKPMHPAARKKLLGFRADEDYSDYGMRVTGILRVYFHIMSAPVSQPLDLRYRMPRFWTWFSRMMSEPQLLGSGVGAEIIYAALDVNGPVAMEIWGGQWLKLLALLYEGCVNGIFGQKDRLVGGKSPDGVASRVRVQVDIERLMTMA